MIGNYFRRKPGQSAPLLALMIVAIVGMVGLSVDVGNAYGQQRRVQNITNAGALAGMNAVVAGQTNQDVCTNVQRTMAGNRVGQNATNFEYRVDYVRTDGSVQLLCNWNGSSFQYAPELNLTDRSPNNIQRVQVTMREKVPTYFARVVGRPSLTVNGNGNACLGNFGPGVYPIGVPITLNKQVHKIFRTTGGAWDVNDANWGNWSKMVGMSIEIPVRNKTEGMPGTHVSWLDWKGNANADDLKKALTYPGTLQGGFEEAPEVSGMKNSLPLGVLTPNDWISGKTGVVASTNSYLADLKSPAGMSQPRDLILPMFSAVNEANGSKAAFRMQKMGHFRLVAYEITGGTKYLRLQYMGDASPSPEECSGEAPDVKNPNDSDRKVMNIDGVTKVDRVWRTKASSMMTYDIVVVMDTSSSMSYDWKDRRPNTAGYEYARMVDAKKAVVNFVQSYDIKDDPDARMAFVTFSGTGSNAGVVRQSWQTACSASKIANNCNNTAGDTSNVNKWRAIQDSANAMKPDGYTPGPIGFEKAEDLLKNRRTPPAGKQYGQIVLFATDGVFNVCGGDKGVENCPRAQLVPCAKGNDNNCLANPSYNMVSGRPVWQGQQVANRIKGSGARVFVVALTPTCLSGATDCFNPAGLPEMSSGSGYYYQANDGSAMQNIYANIKTKIEGDVCEPKQKTEFAGGAMMVLTRPDNPTFSRSVVADGEGNWGFNNLESGNYVVKVKPDLSLKSAEDGLYRKYTRLRNGFNLSEETQASIYLNPQYPDGATVYSEVLLSMPMDKTGTPLNGCTAGTAAP